MRRSRNGEAFLFWRTLSTMIRKASVVWNGDFQSGQGTISTESGALSNSPYAVSMRFGGEKGTNPEELLGASHASCFSMALSLFLTNAGFPPESIETSADVHFDKVGDAWTVTKSHLTLKAKVPNLDEAKFQELAHAAKEGCPISRVLNTDVSLDATLI